MEALGIFKDVESAGKAVTELVRAGFVESQITSLSSVPYANGVLVQARRNGWFRFVSLAGALIGAVAGFGLAAGTAWLYPVRTGDKPIISLFPTGIVTFEVTMVFALVGTVVGMFMEMKLPNWFNRLYDPAISEGCIGISLTMHAPGEVVVCGTSVEEKRKCIGAISALPIAEQRVRAEQIMKNAGAFRTIME